MNTQSSILVIDDEPDNFDVVETLLDNENYQLHYAPSGQQALERLNSYQPDLILLDVMMPDLDGIEVCKRIKAQAKWRAVPIIMVTALTRKEDLAECLAVGADDFMSKPINSLELRARVHSMLRIKTQYDSLQNLLQLREDMANMIVHDLQNPVASIILAAEILNLPNISTEKLKCKAEQITHAGLQLKSTINSLLLLAQFESDRIVLNYTEVDLCSLCLSALQDIEVIATQKGLTLVSQLPQVGGIVKVDVNIFRRVLVNLLSNAMKFSPVNSQIILQAEYLESGGAKVQIADFGPGVPQALKQRIFDKFEIGNKFQGVSQTGLGLAFCKMAIEAHSGTITVVDNYPNGSIFSVFI